MNHAMVLTGISVQDVRFQQLQSLTLFQAFNESLLVFSIVGPKQNAGSLLTPVSDTVFNALSHGTLGFALHGSFFSHFLIGGNSSTANQIL